MKSLSVIIPVYNSAPYLRRCLNSVLAQNFRDIEVICINDASTDNSLEILQEYAEKDERVILVDQPRYGISAARNAGLDRASAPWMTFVDSDDCILPQTFERIMAACTGEAELIAYGTREIQEAHPDRDCESPYFAISHEGLTANTEEISCNISKTVWNKCFRTDIIREYGITFPEGLYYEDNVFTICYLTRVRSIFFIKDKLYCYFRRKDSVTGTSRSTEKRAVHYMYLLDPLYAFYMRNGLFPQYMGQFRYFMLYFFRAGLHDCLPHEQACLLWELTRRLRQWDIPCEPDSPLEAAKEGHYTVYLDCRHNRQEILALKKLKGAEKILYIGNEKDDKVVRLFGKKILHWKHRRS